MLVASAAAALIAAALGHHQGTHDAARAKAGQAGSMCSDPWAQLLLGLPSLTHLTALEFAGNAGSLFLASQSGDPDYQRHILDLRTREPALLLLAFAAAGHTALKTVHFSNADHHHHAPHVASIRGHSGGLLSGHWAAALPAVVTPMLLAVAAARQQAQQRPVRPGAAADVPAQGASPGALPHLSEQLESLQVVGGDVGGTHSSSNSSSSGRRVGGDSGWARTLSPGQQQRLRALVDQVWDAQQQQQQAAGAVDGAQWHPDNHAGSPQPSTCLLSEVEAVEALQLLLPGLASLHFPW